VEALNKAYSTKGVSFYNVLSREPHPGYYGFTQPDSLEMRQEYTQFANAELQLEMPWIIDEMENPMQKGYGGMPNMEFVIDKDGTILFQREWSDPTALKEFLEENIGPSGITDEQWAELGKRDRTMSSMRDNDEVPQMEVPRAALFPLEVENIDEGQEEMAPLRLEAGTLPPRVTPGGQSRIYLTVISDEVSKTHFDTAEPIVINLEGAEGIDLKKDKIIAGKRRQSPDTLPHTMGVNWSLDKGSDDLGFVATVVARMARGEEEMRQWTAKFKVYGPVPSGGQATEEILARQLPPRGQLKAIQCYEVEETQVPFQMEAQVLRDKENPNQGTVYLILKVDEKTGHKWNNLSVPPEVKVKPLNGVKLKKELLRVAARDVVEDTEDRILVLEWEQEPGVEEIAFEAKPVAWICNNDLGWCRRFGKTYKVVINQ
jgi:hypothetical protein